MTCSLSVAFRRLAAACRRPKLRGTSPDVCTHVVEPIGAVDARNLIRLRNHRTTGITRTEIGAFVSLPKDDFALYAGTGLIVTICTSIAEDRELVAWVALIAIDSGTATDWGTDCPSRASRMSFAPASEPRLTTPLTGY